MGGEVKVLHLENYQHEATARGHSVILDEPEGQGGDDRGMTPYEHLLAALGGCTAMTLRMYAQRKKWALEDVTVELRHEQVHAEDCAKCESRDGKLAVIWRRIEITGDLDDEQQKRLREIAARCPVHRTLEGRIEVVDED